nr:GGDEF domain-containing protein [Eubacterium sp. 1001713B170207_170306_E7]
MRKSEAINEKLNTLASYDALTGTMNRNSFHEALSRLESGVEQPAACVYVDANGLHELNNRLGHQAGDEMLKAVADVLQEVFTQWDVYRIGGDEFVVLCLACEEADIQRKAALARERLRTRGYEISIGSEWRDSPADINAIINLAEAAMQRDKRLYYQKNGKERQMRMLNQKMEQLVTEKQDTDTFLSVLAPEFNGVYFVDLGRDTIRHLYIPVYFEEMLKASGDVFSAAMRLYAQRIARPEYRQQLEQFCRYELLEKQLKNSVTPELVYQRMDGSWVKLRVLKFKTYTEENRETLWIFTNLEGH